LVGFNVKFQVNITGPEIRLFCTSERAFNYSIPQVLDEGIKHRWTTLDSTEATIAFLRQCETMGLGEC
jgi:hypothetical protein